MEYWLDALLAIPLLWMLYKGFTRGFIMEIARLIALISGVYLAARFSTLLAEYVYKNTSITYEFLPIIAFAVILISVLALAYFFAKALEGGVKMVAMGWANKAAGAFFGFARGAFLLSLLLLFVKPRWPVGQSRRTTGCEKVVPIPTNSIYSAIYASYFRRNRQRCHCE
jgi:membrane protein required for colicin V production